MSPIKIIADDKIPFLKGVLEPFADITYLPGNLILRESAKDADALIVRTRTKCDAALLDGTAVKFIATATIGHDHIDADYCKSKNITWVNVPGCNSASVQQYVVAALLTMAVEKNFDLTEITLGIMGVGNVGSKVQKSAEALGMKVLLNDPPRERNEGKGYFVSIDEVLEASDIVTIHVPLINTGPYKTFHLFGNRVFGQMKNNAWLINTSRGEVIETGALKKALSSGRLGGAILDVWENEPDIDLELLGQTYISTPHIAGYSIDGKAMGTSRAVQALSQFFGLPLHDFYPSALPGPQVSEFTIEGAGKTTFQVVYEAVVHTYPIMNDHSLLQLYSATFEQQRGQYPVRREFTSYTVKLYNAMPEVARMLSELGFRVQNVG